MGLFNKKTKITPSELVIIIYASIQQASLNFMDQEEKLKEMAIENAEKNTMFVEVLIYHSFCFIEVFYHTDYDTTLKNAILDEMHNSLYNSFRKNCSYSEEEIADLGELISYRYGEYRECRQSENWLREISKKVLTNIKEGIEPGGELEIYHMTTYTALIYTNLPELFNKYKLVLK